MYSIVSISLQTCVEKWSSLTAKAETIRDFALAI